jgi:hypothetical protein
MPAEEHVEPVFGLPGRGARRCSAGSSRAQGWLSTSRSGGDSGKTRNRGAEGCGRNACEAAEQHTGFRDPQRVPRWLSQGLRGRADRRRAGAAMPGKEQGKAFAGLRASSRGRQRWCRGAGGGCGTRRGGNPGRPPTVLVLRPMRPREELFVLRSACGADVRSICGGVAPGGGRIVQCLATNAASLSSACKDVLGQFAAQ